MCWNPINIENDDADDDNFDDADADDFYDDNQDD